MFKPNIQIRSRFERSLVIFLPVAVILVKKPARPAPPPDPRRYGGQADTRRGGDGHIHLTAVDTCPAGLCAEVVGGFS